MKDEVNSQPVKLVIEHIKKQIAERQILPGERLPSERKLSELLKVSRSHVREALQKMELYGIVKQNISSKWNSGFRVLQRSIGYHDYRCFKDKQI